MNQPCEQPIVLLGASTRSAAASALRAGWTPWCADLFADADLQRIAAVCRVPIEAYPHGLIDALQGAPAGPVLYTGALENRPDLIARIDRPLWGNPPDVLRAIRSPECWTQCLRDAGLPCPAMSREPVDKGSWLLKPDKSAGGFGIRLFVGQPFDPRTHFLQERIEGLACSGIYVGFGDDAAFLGAAVQLIGMPWLNAIGFHYAGSIGPISLDASTYLRLRELGTTLSRAFHLRGLFGIDAILRDGVPWPVEINPRYPASLEILERCQREPWLAMHRAAFAGGSPHSLWGRGAGGEGVEYPKPHPPHPRSLSPGGERGGMVCGKAILYAQRTFAFPQHGPWEASLAEHVALDDTEYADIPHAGAVIDAGWPVMTLFASAETLDECETTLKEKAQTLARRLWG